jgi:hypothetical protein
MSNVQPALWINRLHLGQRALQRDGLVGVELGGKRVMRQHRRYGEDKTRDDSHKGDGQCIAEPPHARRYSWLVAEGRSEDV